MLSSFCDVLLRELPSVLQIDRFPVLPMAGIAVSCRFYFAGATSDEGWILLYLSALRGVCVVLERERGEDTALVTSLNRQRM
jgi:hypothetical protein